MDYTSAKSGTCARCNLLLYHGEQRVHSFARKFGVLFADALWGYVFHAPSHDLSVKVLMYQGASRIRCGLGPWSTSGSYRAPAYQD